MIEDPAEVAAAGSAVDAPGPAAHAALPLAPAAAYSPPASGPAGQAAQVELRLDRWLGLRHGTMNAKPE